MQPDDISKPHRELPNANAFPDARKSRALSEEDEFMRIHGGNGSRAIYAIVSAIEKGLRTLAHMPTATVAQWSRKRPNRPGKTNSAPVVEGFQSDRPK